MINHDKVEKRERERERGGRDGGRIPLVNWM